mmetsp:Transcript_129814/g.277078  ORF Transcript_129814/g.277078 Transcript_129814/m.277078 type:complete len:206 (-) Transcript_129814:321-938(-)
MSGCLQSRWMSSKVIKHSRHRRGSSVVASKKLQKRLVLQLRQGQLFTGLWVRCIHHQLQDIRCALRAANTLVHSFLDNVEDILTGFQRFAESCLDSRKLQGWGEEAISILQKSSPKDCRLSLIELEVHQSDRSHLKGKGFHLCETSDGTRTEPTVHVAISDIHNLWHVPCQDLRGERLLKQAALRSMHFAPLHCEGVRPKQALGP